jgi:hypothetical protein
VTTYATSGQSLEQNALGQCATTPAGGMTFADILTTIGCELRREFRDPNDPRLFERRRRLRELFNAVPPSRAKDLFDQLQQKSDPLAQLFRSQLAAPTRKELLGILFFIEFDLCFEPVSATSGVRANPRMTPAQKTARIADVNTIVDELLLRLDARADAALVEALPFEPGPPTSLLYMINRLSTAHLGLFREFFPDGTGGINFDDFQGSFEQFNNGELRAAGRTPGSASSPLLRGQREPNGASEFLFAEFAFLCISSPGPSATDVADWTKALRVFVQTQEIFIHVYRPAPHRVPPRVGAPLPPRTSRSPCYVRPLDAFDDSNFNAVGQSNFSRKVALRAKYARMNEAALRNAARDNLLRAQCMP